VDLGGGTGRLAQFLKSQLPKETNILCVDKSKAMLDKASNVHGIATINADAVTFMTATMHGIYDVILCKEIIHYINSAYDLKTLTESILRSLKPAGMCIICTRPHKDIEYPFFKDAVKKWQAKQPPFEMYVTALKGAGFRRVEVIHAEYPMTVALEAWIDFIQQRIWSIFSYNDYSDAELQRGINELRECYAISNESVLNFKDKLIFIKAVR
jgi:trans-aconitate methyltransferase